MTHRILLVYENPATPEILRRDLGFMSCEIVATSCSRDALEQLAGSSFDVVLREGVVDPEEATHFLRCVRERHPETVRVLLGDDVRLSRNLPEICEAEVYRFVPVDERGGNSMAAAVQDSLLHREETRNFQRWKSNDNLNLEEMSRDLDEALKNLSMVWQPVFLASNRAPVAFEALVRINDCEIKDPGTLISTAVAIGRLDEVERLIRLKIAMTFPKISEEVDVFMNIHPHSLMDEQLLSGREHIASYSERVVIEITEHTALEEIDDVWSRIQRLRDLGYRIALDDMGAGFAGLKSFVTLKPDIVKFDMELVQSVNDSPTCTKLLGSMIALCEELNVRTVGEGIETPEQEETLRTLGCDFLQGYYLGRPQPEPRILVGV